jgi:hypothetical protein
VQHFYETLAVVQSQLYAGDPFAALALITERWPMLARAYLFRIALIRCLMLDLRARAQVGMAAGKLDAERQRLLKGALADAEKLDRAPVKFAPALANLVRAGVAALREQSETALAWLDQAIPQLEASDMNLHLMAARRRRGALVGGDEGQAQIRLVDQWMVRQGIVNPARMSATLTPGFTL